jgi:hypothetical protein
LINAGLNHVFVRAPSDSVESAWKQFTREEALGFLRDAGVHLIPAEGGCFVVAVCSRPVRQGWRPRLTSRQEAGFTQRDLERFRDKVESAGT